MSTDALRDRLADEYASASTPGEVWEAVSHVWHFNRHGKRCPDERILTPVEILGAQWKITPEVLAETFERLTRLFNRKGSIPDDSFVWELWKGCTAEVGFYGTRPLSASEKAAHDRSVGGHLPLRPTVTYHVVDVDAARLLHEARKEDPRFPDPLFPIANAMLSALPRSAGEELRTDRRIIPGYRVVGQSQEVERGYRMFGGLLEGRTEQEIGEASLPLWPTPARYRVPLLELAEVSKLPQTSRGRAAPLDRRLVIRGVISVPPEDRGLDVVRVGLRVGPLLNGLYKDGWRKRSDKWQEVEDSLLRMHNYTVPDAAGGAWFLAVLRRLPVPVGAFPTDPDSLVIVEFSLPPGWTPDGATVDLPFLDEMGRTSGPRFNAYIAHRSLLWKPGITRVRVPGRKRRYGWSRNALVYPVLTLEELRYFSHGGNDSKHRTADEIKSSWSNLPDGRVLPNALDRKSGIAGFRLLPDFYEGGPLWWRF